MSSVVRLFKKEKPVPKSVDDLIFLESTDVERIRKKLSKNFNFHYKFRWRFHPQEDIFIIHYAAARGSVKALCCLAECGVDITAQTSSQGLTPLHFAVLFSNISVMEEIVNRGADMNAKEFGRGYTPLHYAVERKNLGAVKRLMELLADQDIKDIFGRTPLDVAQSMHCNQISRILKSWQEGDQLKSNVSFLASEQRRQNDKFEQFKEEVDKRFQDYDYWRNVMERKVSECEKYQDLRRSMSIHSSKQPVFFQKPCPSSASSCSDLSQVHKATETPPRQPALSRMKSKSAHRSVKDLVNKFEKFQDIGPSTGLNQFQGGSCLSISSASTVSGYNSGFSSRPESSLSTHIVKDCDTEAHHQFAYEEAATVQSNYSLLLHQMSPNAVIHRLFTADKITFAFKMNLRNKPEQEKNEELLDHVMRSDLETFGVFMQALEESGQSHLSDMVRYTNSPYIYV